MAEEIIGFIESEIGVRFIFKDFVGKEVVNSRGFISYDGLAKRVVEGETLIDLGLVFGRPFSDFDLYVRLKDRYPGVLGKKGIIIIETDAGEFEEVTAENLVAELGDRLNDCYELVLKAVVGDADEEMSQ